MSDRTPHPVCSSLKFISGASQLNLVFFLYFSLFLLGVQPRGTSLIGKSVRDIFRTKGFIRIFDGIFLESKRIFATGVRDFLGVKCPSCTTTSHCFVILKFSVVSHLNCSSMTKVDLHLRWLTTENFRIMKQ